MNMQEALKAIDKLKNDYLTCKKMFPYMSRDLIGKRGAATAPYYSGSTMPVVFHYLETVTEELVKQSNEAGHWINQNAIVRLCSILEFFGYLSNSIPIDKSVQHAKSVDIVRRLRNKIVHKNGCYDSTDGDDIKLKDEMTEYLQLGDKVNTLNEFPMSIDSVILPLIYQCREYIILKSKGNSSYM